MSEHYDFHYQPTGSGAISGQQVLQQTEDAINELGDYVNDNIGGAMDVAQQALETAQNAEQDAQTALDTANSFSSAIQSAQQDASTALSTAQTAQTTASNANNMAIQASQDASSAVTTANNASGQVSTLSGTVTALGQRVTTAEGNITTLQNDVTIAQGNASSAMATAGQVKQQAFVFRYSSTVLVASSTNSNALLDNVDNLKVGDKVIDSSGVLFSITAIDTANSTFTIGTALIDLAQDSDVVHKSGNETISGVKTITDSNLDFKSTSAEYGVSAGDSSVIFRDKNNLQTFKIYSRVFYAGADNNLISFFVTQKVDNTYYNSNGIQLFTNTGNKNVSLRPILANSNADGLSASLGTVERKWSDVQTYKVNTLEPSSLSLPSDRSARIDISSYITNLGNGDNNAYTVPANGYIFLRFTSINSVVCFSQTSGGLTNYAQVFPRYSGDGLLYAFFPVRKDDTFVVQIYTSSTAVVEYAYFIPCQGNV